MTKHNLGVDLKNMDFEVVHKEIETDQAAKVVAEGNIPEVEDDVPRLVI